MDLVERYTKKMQIFQDQHPDPGGWSNGKTWGSVDPDWGAKWLAIVQKFDAKFKTADSPLQ